MRLTQGRTMRPVTWTSTKLAALRGLRNRLMRSGHPSAPPASAPAAALPPPLPPLPPLPLPLPPLPAMPARPAGARDQAHETLLFAQTALMYAGRGLWPLGTGVLGPLAFVHLLEAHGIGLVSRNLEPELLGVLLYTDQTRQPDLPALVVINDLYVPPDALDALDPDVVLAQHLIGLALFAVYLIEPVHDPVVLLPARWEEPGHGHAALWRAAWWTALELLLPGPAANRATQCALVSSLPDQLVSSKREVVERVLTSQGIPADAVRAADHPFWHSRELAHAYAQTAWAGVVRDVLARTLLRRPSIFEQPTTILLRDALHAPQPQPSPAPQPQPLTPPAPPPPLHWRRPAPSRTSTPTPAELPGSGPLGPLPPSLY